MHFLVALVFFRWSRWINTVFRRTRCGDVPIDYKKTVVIGGLFSCEMSIGEKNSFFLSLRSVHLGTGINCTSIHSPTQHVYWFLSVISNMRDFSLTVVFGASELRYIFSAFIKSMASRKPNAANYRCTEQWTPSCIFTPCMTLIDWPNRNKNIGLLIWRRNL